MRRCSEALSVGAILLLGVLLALGLLWVLEFSQVRAHPSVIHFGPEPGPASDTYPRAEPPTPHVKPPPPPPLKIHGKGVLQLTVSVAPRWAAEEERSLRTLLTFPDYVSGGKTWLPNITTIPLAKGRYGVVVTDVSAAQAGNMCGWLGHLGWGWYYNTPSKRWAHLAGGIGSTRVCRYHQQGRYASVLDTSRSPSDEAGRATQESLFHARHP